MRTAHALYARIK